MADYRRDTMQQTRQKSKETRDCPFPDCEWSFDYDPDRYTSRLDADFRSERHYEREHAGRVRVLVAVEIEQPLGDRDPQEVADYYLDQYEDNGETVAWTSAEVLEEADDHSKVADTEGVREL